MSPGAFAGSPQQIIADLLRRVQALERQIPSGAGVSTAFGATNVRATQVGFPAELTSSWDSVQGYSWKQLVLSGVSLATPTAQRTGTGAVPSDGNTALTSGTRGWLEIDPQAGGWVFIAAPVSAWKAPVRAATTTAGTLSSSFENGDAIDGVTLATGDRILVKDQSTASENGIYTVNASGAPTRATDADAGTELLGATVAVSEGTVNADTVWLCTANATITVGSTSLPWVKVGPQLTSYQQIAGPNYDITADNTWEYTGVSFTVPTAGTYMLHFGSNSFGAVSALAAGANLAVIQTRFDNYTSGSPVAINDSVTSGANCQVITRQIVTNFIMNTIVTVTGAATFRVYAQRIAAAGTTWGTSTIGASGATTYSIVGYLKL